MGSFRQTWRSAAAAVAAHHYRNHGNGTADDVNAVIWADNELNLLAAFFDDLKHFRHNQPNSEDARFSVEHELRARVEFLEYVFSSPGTPTTYRKSNFFSYGQRK